MSELWLFCNLSDGPSKINFFLLPLFSFPAGYSVYKRHMLSVNFYSFHPTPTGPD